MSASSIYFRSAMSGRPIFRLVAIPPVFSPFLLSLSTLSPPFPSRYRSGLYLFPPLGDASLGVGLSSRVRLFSGGAEYGWCGGFALAHDGPLLFLGGGPRLMAGSGELYVPGCGAPSACCAFPKCYSLSIVFLLP